LPDRGTRGYPPASPGGRPDCFPTCRSTSRAGDRIADQQVVRSRQPASDADIRIAGQRLSADSRGDEFPGNLAHSDTPLPADQIMDHRDSDLLGTYQRPAGLPVGQGLAPRSPVPSTPPAATPRSAEPESPSPSPVRRPKKREATTPIYVRVPESLAQNLRLMSVAEDRTQSEIVSEILAATIGQWVRPYRKQ